MMRASLLQRSPFLLLAALALLAVLFVGDAPPAHAQSTPAISFSSAAYVVSEVQGQLIVTVAASPAVTSDTTVTVTAGGGTATAGSDYLGTSWQVDFPNGESSADWIIPIGDNDGYGEGTETFTLTISAGTGYTVGTQGTATVTILDSPPGAIWHARLTAQLITSTLFGCITSSTTTANKCSTATTLTSDQFDLDGTTYTVANIDVGTTGANILSFGLTSTLPEAIEDYTLQVGSAQFPFGRGITNANGDREDWSNSGLTWAANDVVDLVLLPSVGWERGNCESTRTKSHTPTPPGRPHGLAVSGRSATQTTLSWDPSPTTPDGGSVTDYIVYFFASDNSKWGEVASFTADENAGTTYSETITGLNAATTYEARVRSRTIRGCYSGLSQPLTFTTLSGSGGAESPPGPPAAPGAATAAGPADGPA